MKRGRREFISSGQKAYTLVEVLVAMAVIALMLTSLYAGFSSGFAIVKLSRENLRATQILVQKMEAVRIYSWKQITNSTFLSPTFVDYYNPAGVSNNTYGVSYQGLISATNTPPVPSAYQNRMRMITVTLFWTNYLQKPSTNVVVRTRQMQTYVARYGMQDYIYR